MKTYMLLVVLFISQSVKGSSILSFLHEFPLKTFSNTSVLNPKCRLAIETFRKELNNNDMNAVKMFDATAKVPSGILSGNLNQYGDFDECMETNNTQYCLAEIDLQHFWQGAYSKYRDLVHSYTVFNETLNDPAHRLPGFSLIRWGFCIPSECKSEDLIKSLLNNFGVQSRILPGMCQRNQTNLIYLTFGDYFAISLFGLIIFAVGSSTVIDLLQNQNQINFERFNGFKMFKILMCFSLCKNVKSLILVKENCDNEIAGLHSIRALNALALLMSHKSVSLLFNPYINRTSTIKRLMQPWTIIAKNAILYTDSFMLLSGLLNANALLSDLIVYKTMNFRKKLINRLFRILPNFIAIIIICTYILPKMGAGPLWPNVVTHHSTLCKKYMWRNIFFIHNYFGFKDMCLTHTHQIGIDMQLFMITPIIIFCIQKSNKIGLSILSILAIISTYLRFSVTYQKQLSSVVYHGIPVSKMFETADNSYILPTHRATIYLIGVFLAFYLKTSKSNVIQNRWQQIFIWLNILIPIFFTWMGPYHMATNNYTYNTMESSLIAAFSPIIWGLGVATGIYVLNRHINLTASFGKFFLWKYWQIITKLSYAIYLVQFPIFFYNVGLTKHSSEYQSYFQLQPFETIAIVLCSCLLVLFIEIPFQNVHRIFFMQIKIIKGQEIIIDTRIISNTDKRKTG